LPKSFQDGFSKGGCFCESLLALHAASFFSEDCKRIVSGLAPRRGKTTKSRFRGNSFWTLRKASLNERFHRLRITALPNLRDTAIPNRGREEVPYAA
tara:strand:- start:648 stop:938 length:291 start_codon:yes stop_codon:yes gene_type:complete